MPVAAHLDGDSIEQIARRVAALLRDQPASATLIDAAGVAERFGISRDFVYAHADDLGAIRLGDGERPRLRFDPELVLTALAPRPAPATDPHRAKPRRRTRTSSTELLPVRGTTA
jgi:hypothetical protein